MNCERRRFLQIGAASAASAALGRVRAFAAAPRFEVTDRGFLLDGQPFLIRSGSMHYPRVPRPYWRDRMRKLRALGLNTVCTYVFWNAHEPRPGKFDFSANLDLAEYIRAAQNEGLWVILRPGPYVCTEWDFGGFPPWLLAPPAMRVRSSDPRFLAAAERYLQRVGREVKNLQVTRGGPILLAQVENEYGSYGQDHAYMAAIRGMMQAAGFEVPLYTADGPSQRLLAGGTLPDLPCAINFGDGDSPADGFAELAKFRPNGPLMCGEYWDGWFDHWGERHHITPASRAAAGVEWMLSRNASCNLYMAHGGTSFGFTAGANFGRQYQPDTTSYDYDAPLDEAGRPTVKFDALRAAYRRHLAPGDQLPDLPPPLPTIRIPRFELNASAGLEQLLSQPPRLSATPLPMEALGQAHGLIWYRTSISEPLSGPLAPTQLRDYGRAYQGRAELGIFDRSRGAPPVAVELAAGVPLDLVVEHMGRINFGPRLADNQTGITEKVMLADRELTPWQIYSLPLDDLSALRFAHRADAPGPAFHAGSFTLYRTGDTFLDLRGWGKGYVWVNGHNLGRYWERGPQRALFLPGCWLRRGANQVVVFDWDAGRPRTLEGTDDPVYT